MYQYWGKVSLELNQDLWTRRTALIVNCYLHMAGRGKGSGLEISVSVRGNNRKRDQSPFRILLGCKFEPARHLSSGLSGQYCLSTEPGVQHRGHYAALF